VKHKQAFLVQQRGQNRPQQAEPQKAAVTAGFWIDDYLIAASNHESGKVIETKLDVVKACTVIPAYDVWLKIADSAYAYNYVRLAGLAGGQLRQI
jgi:hypothetical protein